MEEIRPLLIHGEWVHDTGATLPITNPATGEQIGRVAAAKADGRLRGRAIEAARRPPNLPGENCCRTSAAACSRAWPT